MARSKSFWHTCGSQGRHGRCYSAIALPRIWWPVAVPALAHHAFAAEYDGDKPLDLTGVVTKARWVNPHSWLYFDVKATDGTVTNWGVEIGAPNALAGKGLQKTDLQPGAANSGQRLSLQERRTLRLCGDGHAARWAHVPDRWRPGRSSAGGAQK